VGQARAGRQGGKVSGIGGQGSQDIRSGGRRAASLGQRPLAVAPHCVGGEAIEFGLVIQTQLPGGYAIG
jgi:hypothetical protein